MKVFNLGLTSTISGTSPAEKTPRTFDLQSGQSGVVLPSDIPGLIGWYDASASDTLTVSGGRVTAINNRVSGGLPLKALGTHGTVAPVHDPANALAGGSPALVWAAGEDCGLDLFHPGLNQAVQAAVSDLFIVCAYKDGIDADFDGYTRLIADGADATICQGQPGSNAIRHSSVVTRASKNGAAFAVSVLPLPLSVLRFSATDQGLSSFNVSSFGRKESSSLSRSWHGPICEVLAFSSALTNEDAGTVQQYLNGKYGLP